MCRISTKLLHKGFPHQLIEISSSNSGDNIDFQCDVVEAIAPFGVRVRSAIKGYSTTDCSPDSLEFLREPLYSTFSSVSKSVTTPDCQVLLRELWRMTQVVRILCSVHSKVSISLEMLICWCSVAWPKTSIQEAANWLIDSVNVSTVQDSSGQLIEQQLLEITLVKVALHRIPSTIALSGFDAYCFG